jgi:hypothetical protein
MEAINDKSVPIEDLWLADFVMKEDILILDITEKEREGQHLYTIGQIRHCYTTMYAAAGQYANGSLKFIDGGSSWGNVPPKKGETVLIAISHLPDHDPKPAVQMYEYFAQGNFGIREMNGQLYAIVKYPIKDEWNVPQIVRNALLPVPGERIFSAIPFSILEDYLMALIPRINRIQPVRSSLLAGQGATGIQAPDSPSGLRLPNKMMSRRDFEIFRSMAGRRQAYLAVIVADPRAGRPTESNGLPTAVNDSPFFENYCLHGAYSKEGVNLWRPPIGEQLRAELNIDLGGERVRFGALDTWEQRSQPATPVLFFEPDGDVYFLLGEESMVRKFAFRGLPWEFPTPAE